MPVHQKNSYYPQLNALRGLSIIFILLYHLFPYIPLFKFGWLGVDMFFVLSGFLITNILLNNQNAKPNLKNFFIRRALRIFPLYYIFLITFFLIGSFAFKQQNEASIFGYYYENQFWFWTFTQNLLFIIDGIPSMPYLTHLWSLAIEEQFYIFWGISVFIVSDRLQLIKLISSLIIIVILIRCYFYSEFDLAKYYFNTITRIDSLLIGTLLSVLISSGQKINTLFLKCIAIITTIFFTLSIILYGNVYLESALSATLGYTIFALFIAALIYWMINCKNIFISAFSNNSFLNFSGKISYGLYIFHLPVYLTVITKLTELFKSVISTTIAINLLLSCITLVVSYFLSTISYHCLEAPFLKFKKYFV